MMFLSIIEKYIVFFTIGLATKSFRFVPFENHEKKRNNFVANSIYFIFHSGKKYFLWLF